MKNFVYSVDQLIIGNTLSAFLYAFIHDIPLIYNRNNNNYPLPFEFYDRDKHLDIFHIPYERNDFYIDENKNYKSFGIQKLDLYERLGSVLFLAGKIYFGDKVESIFIADDKETIEITTSDLQKYNLKYKKLLIFDLDKIQNLNINVVSQKEKKYVVGDWWNVKHMQPHILEYLERNDELVKEVFFFPSIRFDYNSGRDRDKIIKDAVSVSYLTESQLSDINYSETFASLITRKLMKSTGIKGAKRGFWSGYPGYQQRLSLRLDLDKREVRQINFNLICKNEDNIEFNYEDDLSLIDYYESVYTDVFSSVFIVNKLLFEKWQKYVRKNPAKEYKIFSLRRNRANAQAKKI